MAGLREQMPDTAEAIDQLREIFGKDVVDQQIRQAMHGKPGFYAEENGHTFGIKTIDEGNWVSLRDVVIKPKPTETENEVKHARR